MSHRSESPEGGSHYKYWAFISYSSKDLKWASRLGKEIETFRIPRSVEGSNPELPKKMAPVFRDRVELSATDDITEDLEGALKQSRFLVVLCSPSSAQSDWVEKEIEFFISNRSREQVFLFVVSGNPFSEMGSELECIPEAFLNGGADVAGVRLPTPLAPDRVRDGWDNAVTKLIAGMLGIEYDSIRQRVRSRIWAANALTLVAALLFVAVPTALLFEEIDSLKMTLEEKEDEIKELRRKVKGYRSKIEGRSQGHVFPTD